MTCEEPEWCRESQVHDKRPAILLQNSDCAFHRANFVVDPPKFVVRWIGCTIPTITFEQVRILEEFLECACSELDLRLQVID